MICMSYKKLVVDLKLGNIILCVDGIIIFIVLFCDLDVGIVRCRCENIVVFSERKNVNFFGVVVDLFILTEKDMEDILGWGIFNNIDMIVLFFVRKGFDFVYVRKVFGFYVKYI